MFEAVSNYCKYNQTWDQFYVPIQKKGQGTQPRVTQVSVINPHMHCLGDTSLRPRTNNTFPLDDFYVTRTGRMAMHTWPQWKFVSFCPCNVMAAQIQTSLNLCSLSQGQICPSNKGFSLEQVRHVNGIVAVSCPHVTSLPPPVSGKGHMPTLHSSLCKTNYFQPCVQT